jgi:hypothetical protein
MEKSSGGQAPPLDHELTNSSSSDFLGLAYQGRSIDATQNISWLGRRLVRWTLKKSCRLYRKQPSIAVKGSPQAEVVLWTTGYLRVPRAQELLRGLRRQCRCGLPRTEFLILSRLVRSPDRIVLSEELWEYAWGQDKPVNMEEPHVYIYRLRNNWREQAHNRHHG